MPKIPLVGGSNVSRSVNVDAQDTVNLYAEEVKSGTGRSDFVLYGTPGLSLFATVTPTAGAACRGMYRTSTNRFFAVVGNTLAEADAAGVVTNRGTLATSDGPVQMADDGTYLMIVDGALGYYLTLSTNILATITDAEYPDAATHVAFISGYYLVNDATTGKLYWSENLNNPTAWDGTDFATAESDPDSAKALVTTGRDVWVFGDNSYEVYYLSGNPDQLFERIQGAYGKIGCAARYSPAAWGSTVFWLGGNAQGHGQVFMSEGYGARAISTPALETEFQGYSLLNDAVGYCLQYNGHQFYVISFLVANKSWAYDMSTGLWNRLTYTDPDTGEQSRHRGLFHAFFYGKNYVGDTSNGNIYELSLNTYTDNGAPIVRERTLPHVHAEGKRFTVKEFRIGMEAGVGLEDGTAPQVMLQISRDGGHSWGNELWRSAGKIGDYTRRVIWRRLGQCREFTPRIRITDPVKVAIYEATAEIEVEP